VLVPLLSGRPAVNESRQGLRRAAAVNEARTVCDVSAVVATAKVARAANRQRAAAADADAAAEGVRRVQCDEPLPSRVNDAGRRCQSRRWY